MTIVEFIPVVTVYNGKIVNFITDNSGYQYECNIVVPESAVGSRNEGGNTSIIKIIDKLSRSYPTIIIRDLNGISINKPQLELIKKLSETTTIWVDSGAKFSDDIIDVIFAGAQQVIIGSKKLYELNELRTAFELTENIIFGLEYNVKGDLIAISPEVRKYSLQELLGEVVAEIGIDRIWLVEHGSSSNLQAYSYNKAYNNNDQIIIRRIYKFDNMVKNLEAKIYMNINHNHINNMNVNRKRKQLTYKNLPDWLQGLTFEFKPSPKKIEFW